VLHKARRPTPGLRWPAGSRDRLEGVSDEPRTGRPRVISDDQVSQFTRPR